MTTNPVTFANLPEKYEIPGARVSLRGMRDSHELRIALLPILRDQAVRRWVFDVPATLQSAGEIIEASRKDWLTGETLQFAVVANDAAAQDIYPLRQAFPLVGLLRLRDIDLQTRSAKIGWISAPAARGTGYIGEAAVLLLSWARSTLQLDYVDAAIDVGNEASRRLAERLGFTYIADTDDIEQIFRRPLR